MSYLVIAKDTLRTTSRIHLELKKSMDVDTIVLVDGDRGVVEIPYHVSYMETLSATVENPQ